MVKEITPEIIPRDYGLVIRSGTNRTGPKNFLFPAKFVKGAAIIKTQSELEDQLADFNRSVQGGSYNPHLLSDDLLENPILPRDLEEAIKKIEGTFNIWRLGGEEAIRHSKFYGKSLYTEVKSSTDGRKKGAFRMVSIPAPRLLKEGYIFNINSQSEDFAFSAIKETGSKKQLLSDIERGREDKKSALVLDAYVAATLTHYARLNEDPSILPFNFIENQLLEMEALIAYYLGGERFFEINKKLLDIEGIVIDNFVNLVEKGGITIEVMKQRNKKREIELPVLKSLQYLKKVTEQDFFRSGYRKIGNYVEFKNSPSETIAELWEREAEYKSILFNANFPPLIINRYLDQKFDFFGSPNQDLNHLLSIGVFNNAFFDYSRRNTIMEISIPEIANRLQNLAPIYDKFKNNNKIKKQK